MSLRNTARTVTLTTTNVHRGRALPPYSRTDLLLGVHKLQKTVGISGLS